jgi:hypothetical protein
MSAEEVKDPHNLLVRFLAETGLIGAALVLIWLVTLAFDVLRPVRTDLATRPGISPKQIGGVAAIAGLAWGVHLAAGVDFTADPAYVGLEVLKRLLFLAGLLLPAMILTARGSDSREVEASPAPVAVLGLIAGAGVMLLHATVDVVLFETPALAVFVLLIGSALGATTVRSPRRVPRPVAGVASLALAGAAVATLVLLVIPVTIAESRAFAADTAVRQGRPDRAIELYESASRAMPAPEADYLERAAGAALFSNGEVEAFGLYERARELRPRWLRPLVRQATLAVVTGELTDVADLRRRAVELNPTDLELRLRYGEVLDALGRREEADAQYAAALAVSETMAADEPERLPDDQAAALRERLGERGS